MICRIGGVCRSVASGVARGSGDDFSEQQLQLQLQLGEEGDEPWVGRRFRSLRSSDEASSASPVLDAPLSEEGGLGQQIIGGKPAKKNRYPYAVGYVEELLGSSW